MCANRVLDFTGSFLTPARFVGRKEIFEQHLSELNALLAFSGLELGADGQFRRREAARTIDEAERRAQTIRIKFQGRRLHPEVLKYCKTELMQDNYFHAVFEATKGLAQRIRDMVGIQADGAALVDRVFSIERPMLVMNTLQTETERSQHKGFAALLKGCFGAVRNPLAHEPKILWEGEDDAADYLSLISLLHRSSTIACQRERVASDDRLPDSLSEDEGLRRGLAGTGAGALGGGSSQKSYGKRS